jgi:DNA topoisomerase IB
MEKFKIGKQVVTFYGKVRGSNKNKHNRVNKLASMYNSLYDKLLNMAERGKNSNTENFRCAVATLLLMETGIRVGNESSAEGYYTKPHPFAKNQEVKFVKTYGLTTIERRHVIVKNGKVTFNFLGKKQVENSYKVPDKLNKYVVSILNNCDEKVFGITDYQLTKFIKRYVGRAFTPKDFRTLRANIYAYNFYNELEWEGITKKQYRQNVKTVCEKVAEKLNNTPAVCKRSYINELLFTNF